MTVGELSGKLQVYEDKVKRRNKEPIEQALQAKMNIKERKEYTNKNRVVEVEAVDEVAVEVMAEAVVDKIEENMKAHYVEENKVGDDKVLLAHDGSEEQNENSWYLNTGASNHMCGYKHVFIEMDESVTGNIIFGDMSKIPVKGKDKILIKLKNGSHQFISNVYYVLEMKANILSMSQLLEKGYDIHRKDIRIYLRDDRGSLIALVPMSSNRMFLMNIHLYAPKCLKACFDNQSWLWHLRLGHLNFEGLKLLSTMNMQRKNLDDKSEKFIFIDYIQQSKGYKLYNPVDKKIKVSRDMTFDEKSSWVWTVRDKEQYVFYPIDTDRKEREEELIEPVTPSSPIALTQLSPSSSSVNSLVKTGPQAAFTWTSKKQSIVTLSTCEAEYVAATSTVCHAILLRSLLKELSFNKDESTQIYVDNKSAIAFAKNSSFHDRSKHIDTRYHFIHESIAKKEVQVKFVKSEDQVADIFTKPLNREVFDKLRSRLGLRESSLRGHVES
ncbi:hypothetical protein RJ640_017029 [Escallonia rubra]|uniref:GAG-pre-integrase domain-containing protein n=1 Tax=Escallonia rubra TaxID=112253 RepID=A0AA88QPN2_9ASTE|nr:hypothetical protein RJ640_017029 [Escallonia rubra]